MATAPRGRKIVGAKKASLECNGLLVTGMHRSGTSAMTRVLNLLGCALHDDLIPPNLGNDKGHWEAFPVVALNDQILADAGSFWNDWTALNGDWKASSLRHEAIFRASELVRNHSKIRTLFAIKDPRISRVADIWLEAFDASDVKPTLIIMLRNPIEVARSLEARDLMNPAYCYLLWLRHMLDVEFHTRGRKRVICRYDLLLDNWRATVEKIKGETGLVFPRNSPSIQSEIDLFLDKGDRHHNIFSDGIIDDFTWPKWLRDVYAIFLRWNKLGEQQADWGELDSIRKAFDQSSPAFFNLVIPAEHCDAAGSGARLILQLEEQIKQARLAKDEADHIAEENKFQIVKAESSQKIMSLQIEELKSREGELYLEANELRNSLDETRREWENERQALTQTQQQLVKANERAGLAENILNQRKEELAQLWKELETVRVELTEESRARHAADAARDKESELRTEAQRQLVEANKRASLSESMLNQREEELTQLSKELEAAQARVAEETHFKQAAEAARGEVTRQLAARFSEIATLTKLLREAAAETEASQEKFQWLRRVEAITVRFPRWWYFMPASWRRKKEQERYARHGLFNARNYLKLYPDVAASGMDPLRHYILHGIDENRINPVS